MSDNASKSVSGGSGSKNKSPPTKVSVIPVCVNVNFATFSL